jgi:ATP-binding cassette subfamily B (MDR/TAP) protein 1
MGVSAFAAFVCGFLQILSFGIVGENVALRLRQQLYFTILQKHIGWFDSKDNTPGILSSTMATDVQTINGVTAGGLGTSLQALFSVLVGVTIGLVIEWKVALICLACTPFQILGGIMNAKF